MLSDKSVLLHTRRKQEANVVVAYRYLAMRGGIRIKAAKPVFRAQQHLARFDVGNKVAKVWRRCILVITGIQAPRNVYLVQIVHALRFACLLACTREQREQQSRYQRDNGDDYQQLQHGEGGSSYASHSGILLIEP